MATLIICTLMSGRAGAQETDGDETTGKTVAEPSEHFQPEDVKQPGWIAQRQAKQRAAFPTNVAARFTLKDQQPGSGLHFMHRVVDDAGKFYKAVHYDHGSAVAAADINSDGLTDLYFVSQAGPNGLFVNLGDGRFQDITASAGVAVDDAIGVAASFADLDNDGDADLYVTNVRSPNRLFANNGAGQFVDVSKASAVDYVEHSSAAVFFDYDRDGLLDLFLTVVGEYTTDLELTVTGTPTAERWQGEPATYYVGHRDAFAGHTKPERQRFSRLYKNLGKLRFADVTEALGLLDSGWSGAATPIDINGDGWQDLYVLNMQGHDRLWINEGGKRFVDATQRYLSATPWGSMGVKAFDVDNDGNTELYITDMHSDMSEEVPPDVEREKRKANWITKNWAKNFLRSEGRSIYGNALFAGAKDDRWVDTSDAANLENYWPWGVSVGDVNADGWQDVFVTTSMNYPFRYSPNNFLLNDHGKGFVDAEYVLGVEPRRDQRTSKPWVELQCDSSDAPHPYCQGRSGTLIVHGALGSRSSLFDDIDADGDLDLITAEFGDVPQLLISDLSQQRGDSLRYLKVRLRGRSSNRDGLGARVTVVSGANRYTQIHDGMSGYLAQSSVPLYFGLGSAKQIDRIEVHWPSGKHSILSAPIAMNGDLLIDEADAR